MMKAIINFMISNVFLKVASVAFANILLPIKQTDQHILFVV